MSQLRPQEQTFQDVLTFLFQQRFTGLVFLHFNRGTPRLIEYGLPTRIPIATFSTPSEKTP